jgi:hypothetical protein
MPTGTYGGGSIWSQIFRLALALGPLLAGAPQKPSMKGTDKCR